MSKDQQAPGALEHVRAFINTRDVEKGTDEVSDPRRLGQWLATRGLAADAVSPSRAELERAVALREALRAVTLTHNSGQPAPIEAIAVIDEAAARARVTLRFDQRGVARLEPEATGVDGTLGRLLSIVHEAIRDGTWERLKACRLHSCEWAFYDHTKNRSGAWCNMAVCGNRAKARAYRQRRAAQA